MHERPPARLRLGRAASVALVLVAALGLAVAIGTAKLLGDGSPSDDAARAAMADLIDRRYDALLARDADAYMSTVDPARKFLSDCSRQRFEAYKQEPERTPPPRGPVGRVDRFGNYERVWLQTQDGWLRYFLRSDGGRWFISEPFPSELGENKIAEYAGVKVHYSAGDADLARIVGTDLEAIIARVLARAAEPPEQLFEIRIATLSDPGGECFYVGRAENWGSTIISLNDVRLTGDYDHLAPDTVVTVEHEALHWLQNEHETRQRMRHEPHWWVIEGWPTLRTQPPTTKERHDAICAYPPSFEDLRTGPRSDATAKYVGDSYVVAAMLVERVVESDDAAYWRFFDDFADTTNPYERVTHTDGASFYATWLEGARAQYC